MGRLFLVLAIVVIIMIGLTGTGSFYLSQTSIVEAKNNAVSSLAKGTVTSISTRISLLEETLQKMANSAELMAALNHSDITHAKIIVQNMGGYFPGAMTFRLLLPTDNQIDNSTIPHMGYADLDLVKNTFQKPQLPFIQGATGEQRHLAMTQAITNNMGVIAVILASVDFSAISNSLHTIQDDRLFMELNQAELTLAATGNAQLKTRSDPVTLSVDKTAWVLKYWYDDSFDFSFITLMLSISLVPAFISGLMCYVYFRKLEIFLIEDQRIILKVAKDLMLGKRPGNYPVKLQEMNHFISAIIQFKRALENGEDTPENTPLDKPQNKDDWDINLGPNSLFSEASEVNDSVFFTEQDIATDNIGMAISLDDFDDNNNTLDAKTSASIMVGNTNNKANTAGSIFRAYDIRGIVDKTLTKDIVYDIGRAIGSEAQEQGISTLALARDGRTSSPTLNKSLADGILTTGTHILDIGVVPTPVLYFVAHHQEGRSGVMLTASHNPANYNGVKVVLAGETLAGDKIQSLKKRIDAQDFQSKSSGTLTENNLISNEYIGTISENIRIARPMKVVVDAGNGVAGKLAPVLLKTLGCEVIELFCDIDGTFPNHHPDPSKPENLSDLIAAVQHYQADVGVAFDGDGDRLGVIDSSGKIIWSDRQMMLFSQQILLSKPGAEVIYDVKCSRHLAEQIKKYSGRPTIWKTGHSFMKAKVKETGAAFAGEMSGHLIFNDRWFGFDDALYAAARLLEILSEDPRDSVDVFADFPDSPSTPELNIPVEEGKNIILVEQLSSKASFTGATITDIDGLRVDFDDGFGLIRASNTTPSLVVRFEGDSQEALTRIQEQFRQLLQEVSPNLSLPF